MKPRENCSAPSLTASLAEAQVMLGEPEAAQTAMQQAIDLATALEANGFLPGLLLQRARLASGQASQALRRELLWSRRW